MANRSGVVISRSEIERMKRSVLPPAETVNVRQEKMKTLKQLSNDRVKNWPNTLEALRSKKESYMKERELLEEEKRREIDREVINLIFRFNAHRQYQEAELRRQTRLEAINRANDLLYEQTDKMKYLRSQELLSDVVYSRKFQLDEKSQRRELEKLEAAKHHEDVMATVALGERKDREKQERMKKKVEEVTIARKEQLDEVFAKRRAEMEEERQIGLRMKEEAQRQLERDIAARRERQRQIDQSNLDMAKANEQLRILRDEYRALEEEEMRRRAGEEEVIESRKKVRKALEIRKFEKAQVARQQIIDAATKALALRSDKEQAIMEKQATEQRAKEDKAIADKESRRQKEWNAIVHSRADQVEKKRAQAEKDRIEEDRMISLWMEQARKGQEEERDKQIQARATTIAVKKEQHALAAAKRQERIEQRILESERERALHAEDAKDDDKFREICLQEISRYKADGKPLVPLYRALENKPPDLLAVTGFRI